MTDPFLIRALVPNYEAIREAYRQRSDATRATLRHHLDLQYGPHPDERLDLFLPNRAEDLQRLIQPAETIQRVTPMQGQQGVVRIGLPSS